MTPRNPYLCLTIVGLLGAVGMAAVLGIVASSLRGLEPHASLTMTVATVVGSLASFLVSVPRGSVGSEEQHKPKSEGTVAKENQP